MAILGSATSIALAVLGLGFLIFVHELGHFTLAKLCGVKVEKFSIGFGPALFRFQRGETEYALSVLPLGGFVKMLGEGDGESASSSSDPRSYQNKSVGKRMLIISAGVVMNVILGMVCFAIYYSQGAKETPATISAIEPGSPAFEAGMLPGDEVIAINGKTDVNYEDLRSVVVLVGRGEKLKFRVNRPGAPAPIDLVVAPKTAAGRPAPTIGVMPDFDTLLSGGAAYLPPSGTEGALTGSSLAADDRLIEAGPAGESREKIGSWLDFQSVQGRFAGRPIVLVIERTPKKKPNEADRAAKPAPTGGKSEPETAPPPPPPPPPPPVRLEAKLPPVRFVDFGLVMKPGAVNGVRIGSPAEKAGFLKGDVIVEVAGKADYDPVRLPGLCRENAGKPLEFVVERAKPGSDPKKPETAQKERVKLTATPDDSTPWIDVTRMNGPTLVSGLGLSMLVESEVALVRPGSPADRAEIKKGDKIQAMELTLFAPGESPARRTFDFLPSDDPKEKDLERVYDDWGRAFLTMQALPRQAVTLRLKGDRGAVMLTPEPVEGWYYPDRGILFQPKIRKLPPFGVVQSIGKGLEDTFDWIGRVYANLRAMMFQTVSRKSMGGPIAIAAAGYQVANEGILELIHFLGVLSVNLAVLNFLPILPFDGGHFLFLLIEKIIGRPLPESIQAGFQWLGIIAVLALFVVVTYQDILRLLGFA